MLKQLFGPAWAILEHCSYPLLLLLATPWFLYQLGAEQYGLWMLLTATVSFSGVMNSGTGSSTVKAVSAGIGSNIEGASEKAVNASLAVAIVGGIAFAAIVFCIFWFGASSVFKRMGDPVMIRATGIAASVLIWIELIDNVFSSAMKGAEHFSAAARVEIAAKTVQTIAAALVLLVSPSLPALYVTLFAAAILRLSAKFLITKRLLAINVIRPTFRDSAQILDFAKWGWLQGIGSALFGSADRMLVGALLGSSSLTYYSIASQLAMQTHAVSAAGLSVIFPKVSRKLESGGSFSLRRFTKISMAGNLFLSTTFATALYLIGPGFLNLWIGEEAAGPTSEVLPLLILAYWILALNSVAYFVLLGMGRIQLVSITVILAGFAAIVAAYLAMLEFGLIGAPAGRIVYAVLTLVLYVPIIRTLVSEQGEPSTLASVVPVSRTERPS